VNHWCIWFYFFFTLLFVLVSIALTVTNNFSVCLFDFHVGRTNPGSFGTALTFCCSGHSRSLMPWFCSILDSLSATQSSLLSSGLSKSPLQFSQFWVSEMLSVAQTSSLATGWKLIVRIQWTFKIWVHPPGRSFADKAGCKDDLCNNLNAVTPSCWKID